MTSGTESTAAGLIFGVSGREFNAVHAGRRCTAPPARSFAHDEGERQHPATPRYEQFRTADPEAVQRFFAGAYTPSWRITGLVKGSAVIHRRREATSMTVDEVVIQGAAGCEIPSGDSVLVIQPRTGSLTVTAGPLPFADCPVLVADGMLCVVRVKAARFDVVSIGADVLHKVAAARHAPPPQPIQFLDWRPCSRAAVRAWHRALDYVTASLASADTVQQPLIAAAAAPLLAAALLECYPSNVTAQRDLLGDSAIPDTLKEALSFIHRHAAHNIAINDVATAVHLTPRAVQYLFRQRLDTTPTEYLRRVRLHHAHHDLAAAERSEITVTEIAQHWGFAHTGRFAVLYRQTYGESPHTTLKQ
jgi:AraC-like DNA-binding protein